MVPIATATGEILEQHRRAGPSAGKTVDLSRARLWRLLDGPTNTGRLRGDGNDQEGQVRNISGRDIKAQAKFIAALFEVAV